MQGDLAVQESSVKFGIIIKVSEYLRSLSSPTITYALLYRIKHELNEQQFLQLFNDAFFFSDEKCDLIEELTGYIREICENKDFYWFEEKYLNIDKTRQQEKTRVRVNDITDLLSNKGISIESHLGVQIKIIRDNHSVIMGNSLIFTDNGGAEKIRNISSDSIQNIIESMLLYSPVYNEYAMLPQDVQSNLAEDFYSDKLDTLNYILYGDHTKSKHTFKIKVKKAYDDYIWNEILPMHIGS